MSKDKPHVVILGAGPAGVGAARQLTRKGLARVSVLERNSQVGGNAGSFELDGVFVDYGSHRLHPASDPEILQDIRELLGPDLLDRPRHGRIRLRGRWIHFPLKPLDLATKLPPSFAMGVAADFAQKLTPFRPERQNGQESFASVLEKGLGRTICRDFYFPYALKIWGLEPHKLSAVQARRRVSASSMSKMIGKVLTAVPGLKKPNSGRFYYPRRGFGQITTTLADAARQAGAEFHFNSSVREVDMTDPNGYTVQYEQNGALQTIKADYVWSTIPITVLARCLKPSPPPAYVQATMQLEYRAMILIYLVLEQDRFSEYDAHYFPEREIPITRISEPKNYSNSHEPAGRTVLCAELPCMPDDAMWRASNEELGELVCQALEKADLPVRTPVKMITTRRLRQAYPIYRDGYEEHFERLDAWIGRIDGLLSFGRQGLFAHDNTHHALYMAYAATNCLDAEGRFDWPRWHTYRKEFEKHVVED